MYYKKPHFCNELKIHMRIWNAILVLPVWAFIMGINTKSSLRCLKIIPTVHASSELWPKSQFLRKKNKGWKDVPLKIYSSTTKIKWVHTLCFPCYFLFLTKINTFIFQIDLFLTRLSGQARHRILIHSSIALSVHHGTCHRNWSFCLHSPNDIL